MSNKGQMRLLKEGNVAFRYKSNLEKNVYTFADFDPNVKRIFYEPFGIPYLDPWEKLQKQHTFNIDFLFFLANGHRLLVECKWESDLENHDVQLEIKSAIDWCGDKKGLYSFLLITEKYFEKRQKLLDGIKFLRKYALLQVPDTFKYAALEEVKYAEKIRLEQLAAIVGKRDPIDHQYIYNLLYWGVLVTDLKSSDISLKSWVTLPPNQPNPLITEINPNQLRV